MNRRFLLWGLGGVAVLITAAVVTIHLLVPTDVLRGEIERQVTAATGRSFRIHGALSMSLFPSIALDASDVTLANRPGGVAQDMARIERLRIGVRLIPLFSGKVEADRITLDRPVIALEVARDGSANWELKPAASKPGAESGIPAKALFSGLRINGATLRYANARQQSSESLDNLDADIAITRLDRPVRADGAFDYRGRRLDYTAVVDTPKTLLAGIATKVDVAANAPFVHASFVGFLSANGTIKGQVTLRTDSLKDVASWLGKPVSAGNGLGRMAVLAQLAADERQSAARPSRPQSLSRARWRIGRAAAGRPAGRRLEPQADQPGLPERSEGPGRDPDRFDLRVASKDRGRVDRGRCL
jgi:AsmA protein